LFSLLPDRLLSGHPFHRMRHSEQGYSMHGTVVRRKDSDPVLLLFSLTGGVAGMWECWWWSDSGESAAGRREGVHQVQEKVWRMPCAEIPRQSVHHACSALRRTNQ